MIGNVVGRYFTQSGKIGVTIHETTDFRGIKVYSYMGKWGAGSGHDRAAMESELNSMLRYHPRHTIDVNFWS
jgi:hypothetical protein